MSTSERLFEMGKGFSSQVDDFYSQSQCNKETEDQFSDELQILSRKVLCVCSEWKAEVNEASKIQFAFQLYDPYLVAMAYNFLKTRQRNDVHSVSCQVHLYVWLQKQEN